MPMSFRMSSGTPLCFVLIVVWSALQPAYGQRSGRDVEIDELRQMVRDLSVRVSVLEEQMQHQQKMQLSSPASYTPAHLAEAKLEESIGSSQPTSVAMAKDEERTALGGLASSATKSAQMTQKEQNLPLPGTLPGGATINYLFDGYYGYDFNHPLGRVQYLRAYDVLSNAFSINQADLVLALDPNVAEGRRYGVRLDLQFGQATETLQGNSANEPRPEIYRNIFQVYGTYIFPLKRGLTVDVGKWSSSIGIEGNYTKDQMNYTRSFFFNYLPFYHMGVRASYKATEKLAVNYWIINGTEQSEPTNSYKDELFGYVYNPTKNISWTMNYYNGQDHPDSVAASNCATPVQPGLCLTPVTPAPDGKQHIFDSYATWNATPKWAFALEGDYVISREWASAGPAMSSAPRHVDGGAAYAHYQWTPHNAFAARTEYLSDRGGLFSGTTQALKEFTGTYEYKVAEGLLTRLEYRRDWSNRPFFLTNKPGVLSSNQDTLTVGMVWWYGGKQGVW